MPVPYLPRDLDPVFETFQLPSEVFLGHRRVVFTATDTTLEYGAKQRFKSKLFWFDALFFEIPFTKWYNYNSFLDAEFTCSSNSEYTCMRKKEKCRHEHKLTICKWEKNIELVKYVIDKSYILYIDERKYRYINKK